MGVLHLFSMKKIFYDKMNLRFIYFHVTKYEFETNFRSFNHVMPIIHKMAIYTLKILQKMLEDF